MSPVNLSALSRWEIAERIKCEQTTQSPLEHLKTYVLALRDRVSRVTSVTRQGPPPLRPARGCKERAVQVAVADQA